MRPIPPKLRKALSDDPFMARCVYGCSEKPEWEHCWVFAGRQINEHWAIVPLCYHHHRGAGFEKNVGKFFSLRRAYGNPDWEKNMKTKYGRYNWDLEWQWLKGRYGDAFSEYEKGL